MSMMRTRTKKITRTWRPRPEQFHQPPHRTFNRIALAAAAAGVLDLLSKRSVAAHWRPGEPHPLVSGLLNLMYVQNRSGAMGLFGDKPLLLIGLALTVVAALSYLLRDLVARSGLAQIGFGLVLGGAAGNVIDRFAHHFVVDFIAPRGFYIFNLADACITLGVAAIALGAARTPARD